MSFLAQLERHLLDLPSELEFALFVVGRVDRGDGIPSDFEWLQPVPEEGACDLALARRFAVDG